MIWFEFFFVNLYNFLIFFWILVYNLMTSVRHSDFIVHVNWCTDQCVTLDNGLALRWFHMTVLYIRKLGNSRVFFELSKAIIIKIFFIEQYTNITSTYLYAHYVRKVLTYCEHNVRNLFTY